MAQAATPEPASLDLAGVVETALAEALGLARHELWWRIRSESDRCYSFFEIAGWFHRDHSTILHGVAAFERRLLDDDHFF